MAREDAARALLLSVMLPSVLLPGDGANITYNSQSTFVFDLTFEDGTVMYIYMGDRWNFYGPGSVRLQSYPTA